jgi:hypothetical protein
MCSDDTHHIPPPPVARAAHAIAFCTIVLGVSACSSVPGETTSSGAVQREVRERVLSLARATDPQCRQQTITHTEMLEVYPDGKAAEELWTVQQCGRRLTYVVSFPQRRGAGSSRGFSVRAEQ